MVSFYLSLAVQNFIIQVLPYEGQRVPFKKHHHKPTSFYLIIWLKDQELKEEQQGKQKLQSIWRLAAMCLTQRSFTLISGPVYYDNSQISDKDHCILCFLSLDSFHVWFTVVFIESRDVQPVYNWSKTAMNHALDVLFTVATNTL